MADTSSDVQQAVQLPAVLDSDIKSRDTVSSRDRLETVFYIQRPGKCFEVGGAEPPFPPSKRGSRKSF